MTPDPKGRPVVKIVYTVLESQYQSSLTAAVQTINAGSDTVCYELIGYLLEELRTPANYENFKKDLEDANIFIGSLIFIEDLAEKVPSSFLTRRCEWDVLLLSLNRTHFARQSTLNFSAPQRTQVYKH